MNINCELVATNKCVMEEMLFTISVLASWLKFGGSRFGQHELHSLKNVGPCHQEVCSTSSEAAMPWINMTRAVPSCPSIAEFMNLIYTVLDILFPDLIILDPAEDGH